MCVVGFCRCLQVGLATSLDVFGIFLVFILSLLLSLSMAMCVREGLCVCLSACVCVCILMKNTSRPGARSLAFGVVFCAHLMARSVSFGWLPA